jgi:hypothetical protein
MTRDHDAPPFADLNDGNQSRGRATTTGHWHNTVPSAMITEDDFGFYLSPAH